MSAILSTEYVNVPPPAYSEAPADDLAVQLEQMPMILPPPSYYDVPVEDLSAQLEQMKAIIEQMRLEKEDMMEKMKELRLKNERLEMEKEEIKRILSPFLEAEEKSKKEAEERAAEVARKAEHQRKNAEYKKKMGNPSFEDLINNGFTPNGSEPHSCNKISKYIGGKEYTWSIHMTYYEVIWPHRRTYSPIGIFLNPGEEPALYQ